MAVPLVAGGLVVGFSWVHVGAAALADVAGPADMNTQAPAASNDVSPATNVRGKSRWARPLASVSRFPRGHVPRARSSASPQAWRGPIVRRDIQDHMMTGAPPDKWWIRIDDARQRRRVRDELLRETS